MTIKSARKDTGRRSVKPDFTRRTQRGPQKGQARERGIYTVRLSQIRDVLSEVLKWKHPADAVMSAWFRANKALGGRDRHEVAEAVFDVLRHLRRYRQYAESGTGPALERLAILGLASVVGKDMIAAQLSEEEKSWLMRMDTIDPASLAPEIRGSLPDWLYAYLGAMEESESLIAALNTRAPLDLRINPFKTDRDTVLNELRASSVADFDPQPTPYSPWGIRLNGKPAIQRWTLFENGSLEVQDEGSQLLALLVGPKRTDMVIDFCAGAGGKTLLLGALMRSAGRLYAFDVSAARLAKAKPRIARSGLSNVTPIAISSENDARVKRLAGKADKVLVDAPCTGVGTLRRNPDLKWRQSPASIQELTELQARILNSAARCVAPGGRLVYSTCSVLPQENEEQIDAFLTTHPEFTLLDVQTVLGDRCPDLGMKTAYLKLRPDVHGTDGFFAAVLEKNK